MSEDLQFCRIHTGVLMKKPLIILALCENINLGYKQPQQVDHTDNLETHLSINQFIRLQSALQDLTINTSTGICDDSTQRGLRLPPICESMSAQVPSSCT